MTDPAPAPSVIAARAEAEAARARFIDTLGELRERASPSNVARNAWEGVRDKGEQVAEHTVEFALEKPAVAGAAAAGVAAFVVRKPIARLIKRIFTRKPKAPPPPKLPRRHFS